MTEYPPPTPPCDTCKHCKGDAETYDEICGVCKHFYGSHYEALARSKSNWGNFKI